MQQFKSFLLQSFSCLLVRPLFEGNQQTYPKFRVMQTPFTYSSVALQPIRINDTCVIAELVVLWEGMIDTAEDGVHIASLANTILNFMLKKRKERESWKILTG
jgi:hypothetical protein